MREPGDHELLDRIRGFVEQTDPVPAPLTNAARESLAWRTFETELAELTDDSTLAGAAVRSQQPPRILTFETESTTMLVEVSSDRDDRRMLGQVVAGPVPTAVEVRHPDGASTVAADQFGRFETDSVPAGPCSLACNFQNAPSVVTSWVTI